MAKDYMLVPNDKYVMFLQIAKHIPKYQRIVMMFNAGLRGAALQQAVAGMR